MPVVKNIIKHDKIYTNLITAATGRSSSSVASYSTQQLQTLVQELRVQQTEAKNRALAILPVVKMLHAELASGGILVEEYQASLNNNAYSNFSSRKGSNGESGTSGRSDGNVGGSLFVTDRGAMLAAQGDSALNFAPSSLFGCHLSLKNPAVQRAVHLIQETEVTPPDYQMVWIVGQTLE